MMDKTYVKDGKKERGDLEKVTGSQSKKQEESGKNSNDPFHGLSFKVGVAENKNVTYRSKMEDVHTYIANFAERVDWGYFAIFDGHAGKDSARWCGNNLHTLLEKEIDVEESKKDENEDYDMKDNLHNAFMKADEKIEEEGSGSSGCTAAVAVIRWENENSEATDEVNKTEKQAGFDFVPKKSHKRMLYTSNVGDSRVILCRGGKAYRMSYDHKATDQNEISRIKETGGLIMKNRVSGVLAVTRSLGDSYMKDLVIGKPFTTSTEITSEDEFMILACDGIWDVMSDQQACQVTSEVLKSNKSPQAAAEKLCQVAMDNSTTDNVTVMVVKFEQGILLSRDGAS